MRVFLMPRALATTLGVKVADQVVGYLHTGVSLQTAAEAAGTTLEAVESSMKKDKTFRSRVEMAQAGVDVLATGSIRQAMQEDWRAAAYLREARGAEVELARLRALTTD